MNDFGIVGAATDEEILAVVLAVRVVQARTAVPERPTLEAPWLRPDQYRSPASWSR